MLLIAYVDGFNQGRYQRKRVRCRSCGAARVTYEEKETDVNEAVAQATDLTTARAGSALIISLIMKRPLKWH